MEDQNAIKSQLGDLIRITEVVKNHQDHISRIINKFDSCEKRLGKTENAVSVMQGKASGTNSFVAWIAAFASAFLIAMFINANTPAKGAVMPQKEQKVFEQKATKKKDDEQ